MQLKSGQGAGRAGSSRSSEQPAAGRAKTVRAIISRLIDVEGKRRQIRRLERCRATPSIQEVSLRRRCGSSLQTANCTSCHFSIHRCRREEKTNQEPGETASIRQEVQAFEGGVAVACGRRDAKRFDTSATCTRHSIPKLSVPTKTPATAPGFSGER